MKSEAESINNFKFLIELSITQFREFFNLKLLKNSLALAANSRKKIWRGLLLANGAMLIADSSGTEPRIVLLHRMVEPETGTSHIAHMGGASERAHDATTI